MLLRAGHRHQDRVFDVEVVLNIDVGKIGKVPRHELGPKIIIAAGQAGNLASRCVVVAL